MITKRRISDRRRLEGQGVSLALADGSRIAEGVLVTVGRSRSTVWIHSHGDDEFIPLSRVVDFWEPSPVGRRAGRDNP